MEKEMFNDYLDNRYYSQLRYYGKSSAKNQKKYRNFQWILIVLSAITPVLAAINGERYDFQFVVVGVSALVAILTTGLKTFQYQELWVKYRATSEQLKPEIHYYNFNVGPYGESGVDKESLFISRVEAILDEEHKGWPPAKKMEEKDGEKEGSLELS
ncbi:DUF4231 domain-containing protein [Maribellus maritimus]|uniref:DUF4231 domain-containing protein n=1 Tax=Maribellus maritimus TaxID=2870838 RepID=UPI001EEAF75D|nr:DUF4231 domain-containing protein [Maribellus maritimus]MCG6190963.1 DUF4231 domain-containing protein [Maribellus maritimus]